MVRKGWLGGLALGLMLIAEGAMAFPCFITMIKDSCWTDYTVTVEVLDSETNAVLTTIVVPKGEPWSRGRFEGKLKQHFMLRATFEPAFWKAEEGKVYYAKRYWKLPDAVKTYTTAVHVTVCYPESFSGVPLPPGAGSTCTCPKQAVPSEAQLFDVPD